MEEDLPIYIYDCITNTIRDEDGYIIFDIYRIVSPNVLYMFKANMVDTLAIGINGKTVGLIYGDDEGDDY